MLQFSLLDLYLCPVTGQAFLIGVQQDSTTVAVKVTTGYTPYFYVHDPNRDQDRDRMEDLGRSLSQEITDYLACEKGELLGMDIVSQKLLFGYARQAPLCLKVYCSNSTALRSCAKKVQVLNLKTFEHDKDMRLAFLRENHLYMYGTVRIQNPGTPGAKFSRCDAEYCCPLSDLSSTPFEAFPPMTVAAYDLETEGLNPENDKVFQASLCIRHFPFHEGDTIQKVLISTLPVAEKPADFTVIRVNDEKGLVTTFADLVVQHRVTILCGWNNAGFDMPFLWKRAKKARATYALQRLSFLLPNVCRLQLKEKSLNSSAFGTNEFYAYQGLHGLTEVDGLLMARKSSSLKLNSYKLNAVAKELLRSEKDDVSYEYLFEAVRKRDPDMLFDVAKYCVQDSMLVLQIFDRLKNVDDMITMSSLTNIPLSYIAERGQTVKCESVIRMEASRQGYIWNTPKREATNSKYQGSTVIESIKGLYTSPVAVMDFNSLYPSIIMAYNLSPETFVGTVKGEWTGRDEDLAFTHKEDNRLHVWIGSGSFAVFDTAGVDQPVIPHVLRYLVAERKAVRKLMGTLGPDDKLLHSQLHAKQLALKILANSCYGSLGFANGPLPLVEIAASTTAIGRMSIQNVRTTLAAHGYPDVVAGDTDSVMVLMKDKTVQQAIDVANDMCSQHLNPLFPPPMKIEFEKIFYPYLVFSKKRYAGLLWEDSTNKPKMDYKGIAAKRRDFAPIVSKTMKTVLEIILWQQDVPAASKHVKDVLRRMASNEIHIDDLIIRKELKKLPQNYATPSPHSTVAAKLMQRDPENAPKLGERVPYVIVQGQGEVYERSEDPSVPDLKIDFLYYLNNQLKNPLSEIFRAIGIEEHITDINKAFTDFCTIVSCKQNKQRQITDYFRRNA